MQDKYIILPEQVCFDRNIPPMARLLYGVIASLSAKDGYCWAQNRFFAEKFGVQPETISRAINSLASTGYIRLEFEGDGNEIRRIYTLDNFVIPLDENVIPLDKKINNPGEKSQGTLDKKVKHINTRDNNKYIYACAFAQFWKAYPKKRDKARAQKAFDKLKPDQALLDQILAALEWQTRSADWAKDGGQFIPLASTYLNGRRWEDEPPANTTATRPSVPKLKTFIDENGNEVAQFC